MDPNLQSQPNPGSFMSQAAGQPQNIGPALARLMQLRQLGATPQAGATPMPAAPVETGSPVNMNDMHDAGKQMGQPQPQPVQMPNGGGSMAVNPGSVTFDPHAEALKVATEALSNYIAAHGKSLQADHGVAEKEARAKLIASQAQAPAAPVGE